MEIKTQVENSKMKTLGNNLKNVSERIKKESVVAKREAMLMAAILGVDSNQKENMRYFGSVKEKLGIKKNISEKVGKISNKPEYLKIEKIKIPMVAKNIIQKPQFKSIPSISLEKIKFYKKPNLKIEKSQPIQRKIEKSPIKTVQKIEIPKINLKPVNNLNYRPGKNLLRAGLKIPKIFAGPVANNSSFSGIKKAA